MLIYQAFNPISETNITERTTSRLDAINAAKAVALRRGKATIFCLEPRDPPLLAELVGQIDYVRTNRTGIDTRISGRTR